MGVKKQLLGFSIALGVLIIAISAWVVFEKIRSEQETEELTLDVPNTSTNETTPQKTKREESSTKQIEAGKRFIAMNDFEKAST